MKTKLEIIEDTVAYYSQDVTRRSVVARGIADAVSRCLYNGPDGRQCAFSRCVEDPSILGKYEGDRASFILNERGVDILKEEVRIDFPRFWDSVQMLHDIDKHWDDNGLTKEGLEYAEKLKEMYE